MWRVICFRVSSLAGLVPGVMTERHHMERSYQVADFLSVAGSGVPRFPEWKIQRHIPGCYTDKTYAGRCWCHSLVNWYGYGLTRRKLDI